jgi:predicted Zn-dependent protease
MPIMRKTVGFIVLASLSLLAGCEVNVATGKSQFSLLSRDEEIQMGLEASPQMLSENGGELANRDLAAYVTEVGQKMAATTEGTNPSLPWKFTILNSDIINAFALPGGQVFISRGLLQRMNNEAQLAGVLGHEIGHVTARHINDRMLDATLTNAGTAVASAVLTEGVGGQVGEVAPQILQLGGQAIVLRFGRHQELEADALGMRYMSNVKYNPLAQRQVMQILEQSIGSQQGSEWFSTHPYPKTRIKQIDQLLAGQYAQASKDPSYVLKPDEYARRCRSKLALGHPSPMLDEYAATLPQYAMTTHWCAQCASR